MSSLQQRLQSTLYSRMRRHWYSRWWGILLIIGAIIFTAIFVLFIFLVTFYYKKMQSGELISQFVSSEKQTAINDLLYNVTSSADPGMNNPVLGPLTAPIQIVAFEDFQCPYCLQAQPFIKKLLATRAGDIRFIYRHLPLTAIHPNAQSAAEAAQCAQEQGKFWEFHDELFAHQERFSELYYRTVAKDVGLNITRFNECYATGKYRQKIADDAALAKTMIEAKGGVLGTPTFFVNGELFKPQGYSPNLDATFERLMDYILNLNNGR